MNPPIPQEVKEGIDAFIRDITQVHAINGGFLVKSETRERLKALLHSQAQGLVKEILTVVPEKEAYEPKTIYGASHVLMIEAHNSVRSALLEWAKSKNLL